MSLRAASFLLVGSAMALGAQQANNLRAGVSRRVPPALAPVASAILPGAGQYLQKQDRWVAYLAVEGLGWWKLIHDRNERARQEDEFKTLARTVARARFSADGPDGDWRYYEMMRDFKESGAYSRSETHLEPETNDSTFNGYTWRVITGTITNKADALALYAQRAYKDDMLWSWTNAQLQLDLFTRSTEKRNDADAAAKADIAVLMLNHLISMVDAYSVFRLETHRMSDGTTAVGGRLRW